MRKVFMLLNGNKFPVENEITATTSNFPIEVVALSEKLFSTELKIHISLQKGTVVHITGDSGIGKSILLESMFGLSREFDVKIKDLNNSKIDITEFRNLVGYLSQGSNLFHGSVKDNVFWFQEGTQEELLKLLMIVGFSEDQVNVSVDLLSGGQKQRLLIARTLFLDNDIYIMDEPFIGLDELSISKILTKFQKFYPNKVFLFTHHGTLNYPRKVVKIEHDNIKGK